MTYSSYLAVGRGRYSVKGQNQVSMPGIGEGKLGPISNGIILIVLVSVLGLLYLAQVTKTNGLGYKINELQTRHAELQNENNDLEVTSARLQSLDRVKESEAAKNLVSSVPSDTLHN